MINTTYLIVFKLIDIDSNKSQFIALSHLDPRFPIVPKWSTTRKPTGIELTLSNRHKIPKNQCIKLLLNQLQRMKLQIQRKSATDPFIRVILNPSGATFETLPIYGGGNHVAFTQYDENEARFKINSQQLIDMNCTLHIQAFDSDITSTDKFIGEAEVFLNTETGLIKDIHLFTQIPIKSISSKNSTKFAGIYPFIDSHAMTYFMLMFLRQDRARCVVDG